ncbi:damage-inducible protein DinB [Nibribacter ruber]|uniref:Damage-inducible protein DinB n=1 Tax=Nibribacter ruber TaxID=2698458 RepID=A0A6P1P0X4_9BACT|nr:DinB family protein [Nibribacter ruber]QHL88295.1 damage-inducible protein DinB [Nibribacter ruber]
METITSTTPATSIISSKDLLAHWQGHRNVTRRVIEAFPEKELFEFSIGGMRTFYKMVQELLLLAAPGVKQMADGTVPQIKEDLYPANSKEELLALWDAQTEAMNQDWALIPDERFQETILAFGAYEGSVISTVLYYIDNEIHHRGQGYVYLRALGITPPNFYER